MDKNKIMIAVAAALGVAAVGFVAYAHAGASAAQESTDGGGSLPSLLYATGGSSVPTLPTSSTSVATQNPSPAPASSDNAILASLQGLMAQITASSNIAYNATASDLFAKLPGDLSTNNMDSFTATQSQVNGVTSLTTSATYRSPASTPPGAVVETIQPDADFGLDKWGVLTTASRALHAALPGIDAQTIANAYASGHLSGDTPSALLSTSTLMGNSELNILANNSHLFTAATLAAGIHSVGG